jgi:hypothetical protein
MVSLEFIDLQNWNWLTDARDWAAMGNFKPGHCASPAGAALAPGYTAPAMALNVLMRDAGF